MRRLKITLTTTLGDYAGATNSISYLLSGLISRGHKVYLAARRESEIYKRFKGTGVEVFPLNIRGRFDFKSAKLLARFLNQNSIDVINTQSSFDGYAAIYAKRFYKAQSKVVLTRRTMPLSAGGPIQGFFYASANRIIAVSNGVKNGLIKRGIPPWIISVVHNGIPLNRFENVRAEDVNRLRRRLRIDKTDKVVGVICRRKNQEDVLYALKYLPQDIKVLFLGIEEDENLSRIKQKLKLKHYIRYIGFQREIEPYYRLLDLSVLPSLIEGLSQTILESFLSNVPVVATKAGGNPELIWDGENGFLYNAGDAETLASKINLLLTNRKLKQRIVRNALQTVKNEFNIERTIDGIENIYYDLIEF